MLSDLFVMLFLVAMVLFIVYHFYVDYTNWSNTGNTFAEGMTNKDKISIRVSGRYGEKDKILDCNPGVHTFSESQAYSTDSNCEAKDSCEVELNDKCQARIRMRDRCKSVRGNYSFSNYVDPGKQASKDNCNMSTSLIKGPEAPPNNLTPQQVMNRQTQARAGINDPMQPTVPQECRQGCAPPNGPSGNCENVNINGKPMKKCGYGCPRPTFQRGDTVNCAYDKHCNACEPKKLFDPAAPPNMQGARPGGYCPPGQNCDPRLGQPTMGQPTSSWPGTRIDVPGIQNAPGLPPVQQPNFWSGHFPSGPMPPAVAQQFQQQIMARIIPPPPPGHPQEAALRQALGGVIQLPMPPATRTDALRAQHTVQSIGVANPVQPSGAGNNAWIGRPSRDLVLVPQGTSSQTQKSQPSTANPVSNALFNEQVMTQVLANKNLIPSDINLGLEKQDNFIRVGKTFMKDVSHIRNIALPNIDNDDYESLGRVIAKIKMQEKDNASDAQTMVTKQELTNSVKNILSGTIISNSQVDWETPGQKPNITTTGMYGDNSNSMMGYGDKAKKHHREKPDGGLCLWKGCEKNKKGQPYDSVWSLY